jgi:hypothetical protein
VNLLEADLAVYGIPPKQPDGLEGEILEKVGKRSDDPDAELWDEVVEKPANFKSGAAVLKIPKRGTRY